MNYTNLCDFLEDNKDGFSVNGKKYINNVSQRIYQMYANKRNTALLIIDIVTETNVHSANMYGGTLIEINFEVPLIYKINVKMDKKTKKYSPSKNVRVSSFHNATGLYGNRVVLNALSGTMCTGINGGIFELLDIESLRLMTLSTLRWFIGRNSEPDKIFKDDVLKDMNLGEDLTSYISRVDNVNTLSSIIRYCNSAEIKQSSRDIFDMMYKGYLFESKNGYPSKDKKDSLEFESTVKIELSKIKKPIIEKKNKNLTSSRTDISLSLPVNHGLKPDEVNLINNSFNKLSQYIKLEKLLAIRDNLNLYNHSELFIFVKMWKLIENTSEYNKERFGKFIEGCFDSDNYFSSFSVSSTSKLLNFIPLLQGSSKKIEEFLEYLYNNKHLFKCIGGHTKYYYKYSIIEYIDYYIHVHNLRVNGINHPFYPENLIKSMDDAFAIKVKKRYSDEKSSEKLNSFYKDNDKVKRIFKKYPDNYSVNIKGTKYMIKLPMSNKDFVVEGATLKHCASIYYDLVRDGKTLVLFMRHKDTPDTPLYTIEVNVNDNKLVQVSGEYNMDLNPYSDEEACKALVKFCNTHKLDFQI